MRREGALGPRPLAARAVEAAVGLVSATVGSAVSIMVAIVVEVFGVGGVRVCAWKCPLGIA
jgi:hypothetical protein